MYMEKGTERGITWRKEVVSIHLFIYLHAPGPALLPPILLSSDPRC